MRNKSRAFGLLEVLIACGIMSMFMVSFVYVSRMFYKQARAIENRTNKLLVCKSILEELRNRPYYSLYVYDGSTFDNGMGIIRVKPESADILTITVSDEVTLITRRSRF